MRTWPRPGSSSLRPTSSRSYRGPAVLALILVAGLSACPGSRPERAGAAPPDSATRTAPTPITATSGTVPALPPASDSTVSWAAFQAAIRAYPDSVRAVMQTHSRRVTATLRSGLRLHATEPAIDDVIRLLREVDPAGRILVATE